MKESLTNGNGSSLKIKAIYSRETAENAKKQGSAMWKTKQKCAKGCGKLGQNCGKLERDRIAEETADTLVQAFNAAYCRKYFLKCAYHLTTAEINEALKAADAPAVHSPIKYFNCVTKRMLAQRGY